jgi:hypothetical protein
MTVRFLSIITLSALSATPLLAAPPVSVKVDRTGKLRIPVKALRQLGVKPDRMGSVWVEFPAPPPAPRKVGPQAVHHEEVAKFPPRFLVTVDKGQVLIPRTRIDHNEWVPGKPGTRYLVTGTGHELKLRRP